MSNPVPDVGVPLAAVLPAHVHDPQRLLVDLGGGLAGELGALEGLAAPQVVGGPGLGAEVVVQVVPDDVHGALSRHPLHQGGEDGVWRDVGIIIIIIIIIISILIIIIIIIIIIVVIIIIKWL